MTRIKRFCSLEVICLKEEKIRSGKDKKTALRKEGQRLLRYLQDKHVTTVLMDEQGKRFSSLQFANFLKEKTISNNKDLYFFVGSAYGFSPEIKNLAQVQLSLSAMTFPHELSIVMLCEQIYRGFSIINNLPYHHS